MFRDIPLGERLEIPDINPIDHVGVNWTSIGEIVHKVRSGPVPDWFKHENVPTQRADVLHRLKRDRRVQFGTVPAPEKPGGVIEVFKLS
jgi:hypothetical protein